MSTEVKIVAPRRNLKLLWKSHKFQIMKRKSPTEQTLKMLYLRSGNICAFPDCEHPIFDDNDLYVAQLCHIRAAQPNGPRFDPNQDEEDRRKADNLLLMCHRHHKVTDDTEKYTVEKMLKVKSNHEAQYKEEGRHLSSKMIRQIETEFEIYWERMSRQVVGISRDFEMPIYKLFTEVEEHFDRIMFYCDTCAKSDSDEVLLTDLKEFFNSANLDPKLVEGCFYGSEFQGRNWEFHEIGRPNFYFQFLLAFRQLRIKVTEELLRKEPDNKDLRTLLLSYHEQFESIYKRAYHTD